MTRYDWIGVALNLACALVNGLIGWWAWPFWGAALNLVVVGFGVAFAFEHIMFAPMRAGNRKFIDDVQADITRNREEMRQQLMPSPEVMEQHRVMVEAHMQQMVDVVLDSLKQRGELDPGVQIRVALSPEGMPEVISKRMH